VACTIAALLCPLDVLMLDPPFQQQLSIPFQASVLMEFGFWSGWEKHQSYGIL
jgi:hypothetical protein